MAWAHVHIFFTLQNSNWIQASFLGLVPFWSSTGGHLEMLLWGLGQKCVFERKTIEKVLLQRKWCKNLKCVQKKICKMDLSLSSHHYERFDINIILFQFEMRKLQTFRVHLAFRFRLMFIYLFIFSLFFLFFVFLKIQQKL